MSPRRRLPPALWRLAAAAALAVVFSLYWRPGLVVDLANRIWSCF